MTITTQNNWSDDQIALLKTTICRGSTNDEFALFAHACKRSGLDPFMKQIHAVKRWDSGLKREVMSIQVGIDGFRLIAERTGCYAPGREPTFVYGKENNNVVSATAYVKKLTKDGVWHEVAATAYYDEYAQKTKEGKPTRFWSQMPHGQLAKCAEALALRRAFPAELSGLYTVDEMEQATAEVAPKVVIEDPEREVSAEECATFLNSFGGEKDLVCQYIEEVSTKKNWTMNKTMESCLKNVERFKECFEKWKGLKIADEFLKSESA